jgi:hypothetical protein
VSQDGGLHESRIKENASLTEENERLQALLHLRWPSGQLEGR